MADKSKQCMGQTEGYAGNIGLPKWGQTEAVFHLLFFNLAAYPA